MTKDRCFIFIGNTHRKMTVMPMPSPMTISWPVPVPQKHASYLAAPDDVQQ